MRKPLTIPLFRWIGGVVLLCSATFAPAAEPGDQRPGDRVVLLGQTGPVLIDVRLETGAKSIRQVRDSYCDSLFQRLDDDKSGKLETAEQAFVPMFRRIGAAPGPAAATFLTDGHLTSDDLRKYIDGQLGPLLSVEIKAPRADQTVRLLDTLDADANGSLSVEEVVNSARALARYDLDDDESLSVSELQPFPQSVRQGLRQEAVEAGRGVRMLVIDGEASLKAATTAMTECYGMDDGLPVERCALRPDAARKFDHDNDGRLNRVEICEWVANGPADMTWSATWRDRRLSPVLAIETAESKRIAPREGVSKLRWEALLDEVPLQVVITDNRSSAGDATSFLLTKFITSDRDKNRYLDEAEFAGLGISSPFSAVDLNHDSMVMREELSQFFSSMSQLSQTRVVMTFSDDVTSLFQLMDEDRKNRISPREIASLRTRLTPMDRNHDGQFGPGDFVSEYKISIAFSKPEGLDFTTQVMPGATSVKPTLRTGPLWYQRMDRNRDGDISWREFLGPRAKFDGIDTDHDGLISRDETEGAERPSDGATADR